MDDVIIWRHNYEIVAIDSNVVVADTSLYNVSTRNSSNNTHRCARLQLSRNIAEYALENKGTFVCENQGFQSRPLSLNIPGNPYKRPVHAYMYTCIGLMYKYDKNSYKLQCVINVSPDGSSCQDCLRSTDVTSSDTSISHDGKHNT